MKQAELAQQIPDLVTVLGCSPETATFIVQEMAVEAAWASARSRRSFDYCLRAALLAFKRATTAEEDIASATAAAAAKMDAIVLLGPSPANRC